MAHEPDLEGPGKVGWMGRRVFQPERAPCETSPCHTEMLRMELRGGRAGGIYKVNGAKR